jgi:amino-acid N-acetyltransferase
MAAEQSLERTLPRSGSLLILPAAPEHIPAITTLVNDHAHRGDLLPRSAASIAASLDDWLIGLDAGIVVACGALYHYNGSLAEVRSVAVADHAKGQGWGSALVTALLRLADDRAVPEVFTLTRAVGFFARLGFAVTDKAHYPLKVWKDCQICPLQDNCDETAMALPRSGSVGVAEQRMGLDWHYGGHRQSGGTND